MAACSDCGACYDCRTWDSDDCKCCTRCDGPRDNCGCQYCESCECDEPPEKWTCKHKSQEDEPHCNDCCSDHHGDVDEEEDDGEVAPTEGVDNDYLDTAFGGSTTPEELVEKWASRMTPIIKSMEGVDGSRAEGCPLGYNFAHSGAECKFGYRPDLYVIHHSHTASDGSRWQADFVHYGWGSDKRKPADAQSAVVEISLLIHTTCSR